MDSNENSGGSQPADEQNFQAESSVQDDRTVDATRASTETQKVFRWHRPTLFGKLSRSEMIAFSIIGLIIIIVFSFAMFFLFTSA
jgi:hypothetical protein